MGEGASRGTGLLEVDEASRNDGKPTLLLAIVNVCFGFMVNQMPDIECNPNYGGALQRYRAELGYMILRAYHICYSPVIVGSTRLAD